MKCYWVPLQKASLNIVCSYWVVTRLLCCSIVMICWSCFGDPQSWQWDAQDRGGREALHWSSQHRGELCLHGCQEKAASCPEHRRLLHFSPCAWVWCARQFRVSPCFVAPISFMSFHISLSCFGISCFQGSFLLWTFQWLCYGYRHYCAVGTYRVCYEFRIHSFPMTSSLPCFLTAAAWTVMYWPGWGVSWRRRLTCMTGPWWPSCMRLFAVSSYLMHRYNKVEVCLYICHNV